MRKFFMFICVLLVLTMNVALATENDIEEPSGEILKATIYERPEDMHPNGVNIEIGTASYWLEVKAGFSGDVEANVSYQWYESEDDNIENIKPIEGETKEIFIPEQVLGTKYYCVGVTTTANGKSFTEYTKLLEATFTKKLISEIMIVGVIEPVSGEKPQKSAAPYTTYDLNDYYGYDVKKVSWFPEDDVFEVGKEYSVNIDIEYWDNVEFDEELYVTVNGKEARFVDADNGTGQVSFTFEKLEEEKKYTDVFQEKGEAESSGEKFENTQVEVVDGATLAIMFAVAFIFAFILVSILTKKRK